MPDDADIAQELERRNIDAALSRFQAEQHARQPSDHCKECGDPIDEARRKALPSADRCVDCSGRIELYRRLHRGRN